MTLAGKTIASVRFSTAEVPLPERLTAYRDMLCTSVGNFEVEAPEDAFAFSSNSIALPGLGIAQIKSSALRIERSREMAVDATRDLVLAVVHDGWASTTQRGREVVARGSGAYLSSSHDAVLTRRTAARLTNYSLLGRDLGAGRHRPRRRDADRDSGRLGGDAIADRLYQYAVRRRSPHAGRVLPTRR